MRYRRLSYRYTLIAQGQEPSFAEPRPRVQFAQPYWRPAADICESDRTVEVTVDLAGVDQDELDVLLYENALIVSGQRRPRTTNPNVVYQLAEIRQGPFRLELPLPSSIDPNQVDARYEDGLLQITFRKSSRSMGA
ncbi:MAG: Hsp20/alpha crystallin family protein [Thermomicrobiales bacterium]